MNLPEKTKPEKERTFESNKSSLNTTEDMDLSKKSESEKEGLTSESCKNYVEMMTESEYSSTIFDDYDNENSAEAWDNEFEDDVFYAEDENPTKCKKKQKKQELDTQNAVGGSPVPQTSDYASQLLSIQNIGPLPPTSNTLRLSTISEESETTIKSIENPVSEEPEFTITTEEKQNNKLYEKVSKKGEKRSKKKHTGRQVRARTEIVQKKTEAGRLKKLIMQVPLSSSFHTHILPILKKIEAEKAEEKEKRIAGTSTKLINFPPVPITPKDEPHNTDQKSTKFLSTSKTQKDHPHKRNGSSRAKENTLIEESFEKLDQTNLVLAPNISEKAAQVESVLKESKKSDPASSIPPVKRNLSRPVLSEKKFVQGKRVVGVSEKLIEISPVSVIQEDKSCDKMPSDVSKRPQKREKTSQVSSKPSEASSISSISTCAKTVPVIQFSEALEKRDQTSLDSSKIKFIDPTSSLLKSATAQTDPFNRPSRAPQKPNTSASTPQILNEEAAVKIEPIPELLKVTGQVFLIPKTIEYSECISPVALEDTASVEPVSKKLRNLAQQSPNGTGENIWDDFRISDIKRDETQSDKIETPMTVENLEPAEQSNEAPISEAMSSVVLYDSTQSPNTTSLTEYIKTSLPFAPQHFIEGATSLAAITHNEYIRQVFMCEVDVYRAFKQHLPEEGHIRDLIGRQVYPLTCCTEEEDCDQLCPVCEFCCHEYYCTCRPHILRGTVWCIHLHAVIHKGQHEGSVTFVMDKWQMKRSEVTHLRATCYDIANVTVSNDNLFTIQEFGLLKAQVIRSTTLQICDECEPMYCCSTCNICRHVYRCICIVFRRGDLCEHCHVVALYQKRTVEAKSSEGSYEEVSNSTNVSLTSSENANDLKNDGKNANKSPHSDTKPLKPKKPKSKEKKQP